MFRDTHLPITVPGGQQCGWVANFGPWCVAFQEHLVDQLQGQVAGFETPLVSSSRAVLMVSMGVIKSTRFGILSIQKSFLLCSSICWKSILWRWLGHKNTIPWGTIVRIKNGLSPNSGYQPQILNSLMLCQPLLFMHMNWALLNYYYTYSNQWKVEKAFVYPTLIIIYSKYKQIKILTRIKQNWVLPLNIQNSEGNGKQELEVAWVKHTEQLL